ncbi:MAG TPA: TIGR01777 family oxidoreductase [Trebonia sp.]|jgi:hypothetical protein|nr:TIGR01777 family oxidoreductase [Trebonia sp.]
MKVAITGSSGLIGSTLSASLRADGHEVVRLVRRPPRDAGEVRWDPRAADAGISGNPAATPLHGIDACVHLAGAGVGDHRWTDAYKAEIRASRVLATSALATALTKLDPAPKVLLTASAIGWYGQAGGQDGAIAVTEDAPAGQGFLARVVHDWEAAAAPAAARGIRVAQLRSGLVLSARGGVLKRLAQPAKLGVLPRFGDGTQVMSWISLTDEIRAIRFLLDSASASGPFNLTAPNPVTNSEFTAALMHAFRRPDFPWVRVPAPLLKLGLGEMSAELLGSARVAPKRLLDAGFEFTYPTIRAALAAELAL